MPPPNEVNQLAIATVNGAQATVLTNQLLRDGFYVTQVDSSGGILRETAISLRTCGRRPRPGSAYAFGLPLVPPCSSSASSMIRATSCEKLMPSASAARGTRLVSVSPGMLFTSSTYTSSPAAIISTREKPRHPRAR